ncbi:MAG: flagellar assembly protein FliW [Acidimicrobiia bacterium]|nr:flagellar assembly protein FliW [Acidimicrobiia bacterium]MDH4308858.1 flagellar assembly protein FliW [Acidimicrobiia bacterium]MDH5292781.1 flagellar assembly protein FliW [Acidimicrobiia bacterium]MDH5521411.1 flagellar assembly protein FliW [Acidimicrobiia bacterium]
MEQQILEFDDGIPGFPDARRFQLVELVDDGAFQLLQSVDDPDLAIVVAVPWLFFSDYAPELTDVDQDGLGIESEEDAVVFCAVTLESDRRTAHMNLLGPFVVNVKSRKGRQIVLTDQDYPIRALLPLGVS